MLRILIFLFSLVLVLNAQDADSIVERIQAKFSTVKDLKANFIQKNNSPSSTKTITISGKFFFKKENKFRIEVKNNIISSDGTTIWNNDKVGNKVIISAYEEDYTTLSLPTLINIYPNLCDKELISQKGSTTQVKLVPSEDQLNFKSAIISIDTDDIIKRIEITDFNDMKYIFELESILLNSNLSDQLFEYESVEGVEVIDLR